MPMQDQHNRIRAWDWLLILGLTLAPMTGLRIWKIGPAELLVLVWCLRYLPRRRVPNGALMRFFLLFYGAMAIGTMMGLFLTPEETDLSDWPTWLYLMLVSLCMYQGLRNNELVYNEKLLTRFATLATLLQLLLYIMADSGVRTVFGAPLWFYYRYSGGGTNPHQVAVMMCGLTFVFAREILNKRHLLWNLLLLIGSITVLLATQSSTGVMALAMGLFLEFLVYINRMAGGRRGRVFLILLEGLVCTLLMLVLYRLLYSYAYTWISNDSNGLGRLEIFANIKTTFEKDPFFGLGPGMHSTSGGRLIEYHNTYLEILAASGMVGASAFLIFTIRLLQKITRDTTFLPAIAAMYAYGFAGFAMRRLVYWGIVVFVLVICEQIRKNTYIAYHAREPV